MGKRSGPYDHFADVFNGALESSGLVLVLSNYVLKRHRKVSAFKSGVIRLHRR